MKSSKMSKFRNASKKVRTTVVDHFTDHDSRRFDFNNCELHQKILAVKASKNVRSQAVMVSQFGSLKVNIGANIVIIIAHTLE